MCIIGKEEAAIPIVSTRLSPPGSTLQKSLAADISADYCA